MEYLQDFSCFLQNIKLEFKGASGDEIEMLEKKHGKLPVAYVEFLNLVGGDSSVFLEGLAVEVKHYKFKEEGVIGILTEENDLNMLVNEMVLVYENQSYVFSYILSSEGDNPPVYIYFASNEIESKKINIIPTFSEFIKIKMIHFIKVLNEIDGIDSHFIGGKSNEWLCKFIEKNM